MSSLVQASRRGVLGGLMAAFAPRPAAAAAPRHLDLEIGPGNLEAYLKARSDISGKMSIQWTSGVIWSLVPGRKARALMIGHGVNTTRCIKDATGYAFLQRECLIWSDIKTGEPLTTWFNPFTEKTNEVFHIQNDSVSSHYDVDGPRGPYHTSYMEHSGDVTFYNDLLYSNPSVLTVEDYPAYSGSNLYEGAGLYNYHVKRADLDNPNITAAPMTYSHTGVRQWLPWMGMGGWEGQMVLPSRGKKLSKVVDIPPTIRNWLEKNAPRYLEAPELEQRAERRTFYGEFKKHIDAKRTAQK